MKKLIWIAMILSVFYQSFGQEHFENLGLISQLVEVKYTSEAYLLQNKSNSDSNKIKLQYNLIRLQLDRVIYQLIADMRMSNSPHKFKVLNMYYSENTLEDTVEGKLQNYKLALQEIGLAYKDFIPQPKSFGVSDASSIVQLGWTILKDIKDIKSKKVEGIAEILDKVRLSPSSELLKTKKG